MLKPFLKNIATTSLTFVGRHFGKMFLFAAGIAVGRWLI